MYNLQIENKLNVQSELSQRHNLAFYNHKHEPLNVNAHLSRNRYNFELLSKNQSRMPAYFKNSNISVYSKECNGWFSNLFQQLRSRTITVVFSFVYFLPSVHRQSHREVRPFKLICFTFTHFELFSAYLTYIDIIFSFSYY